MVFCKKFNKDLPGLDNAPLPGELGQNIRKHISQDAWNLWLEEQTKIINELKLKMFEPDAQQTLEKHLKTFLNLEDLPNR